MFIEVKVYGASQRLVNLNHIVEVIPLSPNTVNMVKRDGNLIVEGTMEGIISKLYDAGMYK